jgi:hypothetical protein
VDLECWKNLPFSFRQARRLGVNLIRLWWERYKVGRLVVLFVITGNLALSVVVNSYSAFDPAKPPGRGFSKSDSKFYLAMYFGEPVDNHARYRVVVPYLARLVPDIPSSQFFNPNRSFDRVSLPSLKFAIVNLVFLIATCVVLYYLIQGFGLSPIQGLLSGLLFLSLLTLVMFGGTPMIEPAYFFFLALAVLAVQRQNVWLLAVATIIGVFTKEQVLLVVILIALSPLAWQRRFRLLVGVLPAIVSYAAARLWLAPAANDLFLSGQFLGKVPRAVQVQLFSLYGMARFFLTFGLLWVPFIYALVRCRVPTVLKRWAWFIPILFIGMIALGGGIESGAFRHMAAAFPIVIPLALIGLDAWYPLSTTPSAL